MPIIETGIKEIKEFSPVYFYFFGQMEFTPKITIAVWYKLPDNFYGSFHF